MVSHKISKLCIWNTLDIKSKKWFIIVLYTPILLTVPMSGPITIKQI